MQRRRLRHSRQPAIQDFIPIPPANIAEYIPEDVVLRDTCVPDGRLPEAAVSAVAETPPGPADFWQHVLRRGDNDCWPWLGSRSPSGRPYVSRDHAIYNEVLPHRIAYALTRGPIERAGLVRRHAIKHTSGGYDCCNPAHLYKAGGTS